MENSKLGTISTSHISQATAKKLDENELPFTVWSSHYGWIMYTKHIVTCEEDTAFIYAIPEDLRTIMTKALEQGLDFIRIDQDGECDPTLPTYPWP